MRPPYFYPIPPYFPTLDYEGEGEGGEVQWLALFPKQIERR